MFYVSLIPFILIILIDFKKSLHMAQQNLYNDDNRFLKWTFKDFIQFKTLTKCSIVVIITYLILIIFRLNSKTVVSIYFFLVCLVIYIIKLKEEKLNDTKIGLKITPRVKRLIITNILLLTVFCFLLRLVSCLNLKYLLLFIYDFALNFIVILSIIINKPVEKLVYLFYKTKAINKLKQMNNLKVIGITGSYGKTSSKNILSDILNVKYNALSSPKNFNTPYGLIITVNNYLNKFDDVLIAEMGAYKVGEIKELCELVKPQYGILTKIGTAHIEIFGSQENIQKGKFELIESLPSDGIGILNADDEFQRDYKLKNNCKIVWIGIDSKDADVRAININTNSRGTTFDVIFKGDKNKYEFTTKLLGYNNIYNILAALALSKEFGLTIKQMQKAVLNVKSVEHRLELRYAGNITYIDDSYNSNPVGSKMALEVLGNMPGFRIVMTPGMVELGDKSYELNKKFGTYMKDRTDAVILVGKKITKPIKDGLEDVNYNDKNIYTVKTTKEAFDLVKNLTANKEAYVLIENDLPDIYNE